MAAEILDQKGIVVGVIGIARDVTEQRELEQRLVQSQKMDAICPAHPVQTVFRKPVQETPPDRDFLASHYIEGKSLQEPATDLARAASGVGNTISRCLKRLRACLN